MHACTRQTIFYLKPVSVNWVYSDYGPLIFNEQEAVGGRATKLTLYSSLPIICLKRPLSTQLEWNKALFTTASSIIAINYLPQHVINPADFNQINS